MRCFPAIFEPRQTSAAFCVKSKTRIAMSMHEPSMIDQILREDRDTTRSEHICGNDED
jgi:hypothetical protein